MRYLLISTAILLSGPALADRFETTARIDAVTVYPWGAGVNRTVQMDLPQGAHELVVTGMPVDIDPSTLRVTGEGATIGAVSLQINRALPAAPVETTEFLAAKDMVRRLEDALAQHDARVAEITARGTAAEDMIEFLMKLAESDSVAGDFAGLTASARDQMIEARQTIVRTAAEAEAANRTREDMDKEIDRARTRLEALRAPENQTSALVIAVQGNGAPASIRIASLTRQASWQPVYDLSLQRKEAKLSMDRGLMVAQNSGEDWTGVHLTLSTARPMDQAAPSELSPHFVRVMDKDSKLYSGSEPAMMAADSARMQEGGYVAPITEVEPVVVDEQPVVASALLAVVGETEVYDYPTPVDIRDGADALRLPLDSHALTPEIVAEAVPSRDNSAYLVADTVNSTGAVILPGEATFYADGAMVGRGTLELTAAGDDMKLGFGPLTGIKLERQLPDETEGNSGLILKSAERTETAILGIRNLTAEEWPLRVIDQVPVSRQEDLRVDWSADPAPDETDPEGKRGLLVWNGKIAPGEEQKITLTTSLRWPDGMALFDD
ncbi:mucoidy inhibitor MuiA family protein [Paracoccus lutimaris]|uniref:Uncharacterized protein (TIGR02231 family) n=1 Tax=Paracoccus lutimaris TaxID=1490030 RepID=A0A368Z0A2_9RHOB|nr:mucoidy inhibitor MuiA family protein [Paracoccus lutimaris]RCW83874.1 uncharacterized protein (TIGR02231 family) [Paracoccus lutimaris]